MSYGSSTAEGYRQVIYVGKILNGARTGALRAALRWPTASLDRARAPRTHWWVRRQADPGSIVNSPIS